MTRSSGLALFESSASTSLIRAIGLEARLVVEPNDGACIHESTISVIESGRELVVCEGCGDVTVRYSSGLSADVSRSQFARKDGFLRLLLTDIQEVEADTPAFGSARG